MSTAAPAAPSPSVVSTLVSPSPSHVKSNAYLGTTTPKPATCRNPFLDLIRDFPLDEGKGRFPVPGDYPDDNGEWMDLPEIYRVVGFSTHYSAESSTEYTALSEPFMTARFVEDPDRITIVIHEEGYAEAFRRYADEVLGIAFMTVRNPLGDGYMFLHMEKDGTITDSGRLLFQRIATYLNARGGRPRRHVECLA